MPDENVEPDKYTNKDTCEQRFKYLKAMLKHLLKRWRWENLVNLKEFHRAREEGHSVVKASVGDVVTIFKEEVQRNKWKLGIVKELIKGKDGVVRGATVRLMTYGKPICLSRPVQKLYSLEIKGK